MGYLTSGKGVTPKVIKDVIAKIYQGVRSQAEVDRLLDAFKAELSKLGIRASPLPMRDAKMIYDKKLGVVPENYHFSSIA